MGGSHTRETQTTVSRRFKQFIAFFAHHLTSLAMSKVVFKLKKYRKGGSSKEHTSSDKQDKKAVL